MEWEIIYWMYSKEWHKLVRAMIYVTADTKEEALRKSRITKSLISIRKA